MTHRLISATALVADAQGSAPARAIADDAAAPAFWRGLWWPSLRAGVLTLALTGIAYPLLTTGLAQGLMPHAASGSLIERGGQTIGSAHIGQAFTSPRYFHGRPSATTAPDPAQPGATIAAPYNPAVSAASNHGVTSEALAQAAQARAQAYRSANGLALDVPVPVDAVTASGSGLDPHISQANAQRQLARVAQARDLSAAQVQAQIDRATEGRSLGLLGEPRVHVLRLNLALDALQRAPSTTAGHGTSTPAQDGRWQLVHGGSMQGLPPEKIEVQPHTQSDVE